MFSVGLLGFVGVVINLLNRPTDGATVHGQKSVSENVRPKKSYFSSAWEYVKLPFSLRVPKSALNYFSNVPLKPKNVTILRKKIVSNNFTHKLL
jgi:hypothetical protein